MKTDQQNFRIDTETARLMNELAKKMALSKTAILKIAIRLMAKKEGIK